MRDSGKGKGNQNRGGQGGPARRVPPPDATGDEAKYLWAQKESGKTMAVRLKNGDTHVGKIEYFDLDMIKLTTIDGPNLFIRKDDIVYMAEPT